MDKPSKGVQAYIREQKINLIQVDVWTSNSDWEPLNRDTVSECIKTVLDNSNYPMLIIDSECLLIGIIRKVEGWSFTSILSEYRRLMGEDGSGYTEQFIEFFDTDSLAS